MRQRKNVKDTKLKDMQLEKFKMWDTAQIKWQVFSTNKFEEK
jgi:hypothetical protein